MTSSVHKLAENGEAEEQQKLTESQTQSSSMANEHPDISPTMNYPATARIGVGNAMAQTAYPYPDPYQRSIFAPYVTQPYPAKPTQGGVPLPTGTVEEKMDDRGDGKKKRANWNKDEDELLARSFVTINDDPIVGNKQRADAFWCRVASYYNEHRAGGFSKRSASVIRSHWHNTIQKKVYRFNECYNSICGMYRSGSSDEDILRLAYEKYRSLNNGVAFNMEHVWRIVKDRPLFTPQSADYVARTKKTRTSESGASNTSSTQDASIDLDVDDNNTSPMGQKSAKRKGKSKVKPDIRSITEHYNTMLEQFNEYKSVKQVEFQLKQEEHQLKQKQLEVDEIKAKAALNKSEAKKGAVKLKEYEILNKDTSQMSATQLMVHEHLCQDIRERWNLCISGRP